MRQPKNNNNNFVPPTQLQTPAQMQVKTQMLNKNNIQQPPYNPQMQQYNPQMQQYNPQMQQPQMQQYNPQMQQPQMQQYNPQMQQPQMQQYNPQMQQHSNYANGFRPSNPPAQFEQQKPVRGPSKDLSLPDMLTDLSIRISKMEFDILKVNSVDPSMLHSLVSRIEHLENNNNELEMLKNTVNSLQESVMGLSHKMYESSTDLLPHDDNNE
jgi:hypothetical protein